MQECSRDQSITRYSRSPLCCSYPHRVHLAVGRGGREGRGDEELGKHVEGEMEVIFEDIEIEVGGLSYTPTPAAIVLVAIQTGE